MRRLLVTAVFLIPGYAVAALPAEAIAAGRARLERGDCRGAIGVFQSAVPDAAALQPEKTRTDALAAIHFYSALAFSNCGLVAKAREEVREFLRFHPGYSSLDARKYPGQFVSLFDEVQRAVVDRSGPTSFSHYYPGYNAYTTFASDAPRLLLWATSPEFQLFGDDEERDRWHLLREDEDRSRFVESFWRKRDPDPSTPENAFRESVLRRVAFADRVFSDGDNEMLRGSLTDRGRVFVLLGVPARVYRKPLTRSDGAFIASRSPLAIDGMLERWIYFKDQLPAGTAVTSVEFRFISQQGYGDNVMQKDFWAMKSLAGAQTQFIPRD